MTPNLSCHNPVILHVQITLWKFRKICSHHFLAKIPWNQCILVSNYSVCLCCFHDISFLVSVELGNFYCVKYKPNFRKRRKNRHLLVFSRTTTDYSAYCILHCILMPLLGRYDASAMRKKYVMSGTQCGKTTILLILDKYFVKTIYSGI